MNSQYRQYTILLLALSVLTWLVQPNRVKAQDLPAERVGNYTVEITQLDLDVLSVREVIQVEVRHEFLDTGIERLIPLSVLAPLGFRNRMNIELLSVMRNGKPESYTAVVVPRQGVAFSEDLRIRTGKERKLLPKGSHTFELRYFIFGGVYRSGAHRSLLWTPLNGAMPVPIEKFHFTFRDEHEGIRNASISAFSGGYAVDESLTKQSLQAGEMSFTTEVPVSRRTRLELDIRWTEASKLASGFQNLRENSPELIVGLFFGAFLLLFFFGQKLIWGLFKRDEQRDPVEAVTSISALELGYLKDKDIRIPTLAAAIVSLAWRGLLHIEERKGSYHLLPQETDGASAALPFERKVVEYLFQDGKKSLLLSVTNASRFEKAVKVLRTGVRNQLIKRNLLLQGPLIGLLLFIFSCGLWCMAITVPAAWRLESIMYYALFSLCVIALILSVFAWLPLMIRRGDLRRYFGLQFPNWSDYRSAVLLGIVFFLLILNILIRSYESGALWGFLFLTFLTCLMCFFIYHWVSKDEFGQVVKQSIAPASAFLMSDSKGVGSLDLRDIHPHMFVLDLKEVPLNDEHIAPRDKKALSTLGVNDGYLPHWYRGEVFAGYREFLCVFNEEFTKALYRTLPSRGASMQL